MHNMTGLDMQCICEVAGDIPVHRSRCAPPAAADKFYDINVLESSDSYTIAAAWDDHIQEHVTLKFFHKASHHIETFRREAEIAYTVSCYKHPCTIQLLEAFHTQVFQSAQSYILISML